MKKCIYSFVGLLFIFFLLVACSNKASQVTENISSGTTTEVDNSTTMESTKQKRAVVHLEMGGKHYYYGNLKF